MRNYLLTGFFFIFSIVITNAQNLFDFEHTTLYAKHLLYTRQYTLAVEELERALFMKTDNDSIKNQLLWCYSLADMKEKGYQRAIQLYPDQTKMPSKIADSFLALLMQTSRWTLAEEFINKNIQISDETKKIYQITLAFHKYDMTYLNNFYLHNDTSLFPKLKEYGPTLKYCRTYKLKSPILAGCLSAIIPGSGKIYANDLKEGLISMLFVSMTAYQAYRGFDKRGFNAPYFYIYSGLTLAFYSGNIYGSVKSARRYNSEVKKEMARQSDLILRELIR